MRVTMRRQISGTRDGLDWPGPGKSIDLPDDEAASLIGQGMAEPADTDPVETATASGGKQETATVNTTPAKK